MLENILRSDSIKDHKTLLHQAGFEHADVWFQCFNFGSFIALKTKKPMIEFDPFYRLIAENPFNPWLDKLPHQLAHWRQKRERDDIKKWLNIIDNPPQVTPSRLDLLHRVHAEITPGFSDHQREDIKKLLRG